MSKVKYPYHKQIKLYKKQLIYLEEYYQFFKECGSYEDMKKVSLIKKYIKLCRNSFFIMSMRYSQLNLKRNR